MPSETTLPVYWQPGEHIFVTGQTGSGKTYLIRNLIKQRNYVVFIRTKDDDITLPGFSRERKANSLDDRSLHWILLEPKYEQQRYHIAFALEKIWRMGGWTVVIDEQFYLEYLGLRQYVERLLTQGRSKRISVIVGTQRPVRITPFARTEPRHAFAFYTEGTDVKRTLTESMNSRFAEAVSNVEGHNFVYFYRPTRVIAIGNANNLGRIIAQPKRRMQSETT